MQHVPIFHALNPCGYNFSIFSRYHLAQIFPYYITPWGWRIHPHILFEAAAYVAGIYVYLRLRRCLGDKVPTLLRWAALATAIAGGTLGAKLLFLLEDPQLTWRSLHDPAYLMGGKTIVGGLVFGLIAVEAMKRYIGLKQSTGDLYAIPLAVGIAIGRIGCFLTGLADNTYGTASALPWAIDFGDGVRRHPTQLYETIFLLALVPVLYRVLLAIRRGDAKFQSGDAFKLFMAAYMLFRLLCDFIKPYPRIFFGLGGIQWACLLVLLYYARDIARWLLEHKSASGAGKPASAVLTNGSQQ